MAEFICLKMTSTDNLGFLDYKPMAGGRDSKSFKCCGFFTFRILVDILLLSLESLFHCVCVCFYFSFLCINVLTTCMYVQHVSDALRGHKRVSDLLELE